MSGVSQGAVSPQNQTQAAVAAAPALPLATAGLWVYRVEEGLGNACALIFSDGSGAVVDWGTNRDAPLRDLVGILLRASRPRLHVVVATHPHADHTLGIAKLLETAIANGITVDRFVFPTPIDGPGMRVFRKARFVADKLGIPMSSISVSTLPESPPAPALAVGFIAGRPELKWILRAIAPHDTRIGRVETRAEIREQTPGNPSSLVLQFAFVRGQLTLDRGRAILPGDAEPATLNWAQRRSQEFPELSLTNDALVIPHHGSKHNWVKWFKNTLQGFALVSAPSNRINHPAAVVLKELAHSCGRGQESRLMCTSYAGACYKAYVNRVAPAAGMPAKLDPCFGDIAIELSADDAPKALSHDADGPGRRRFGYCGQ